VIPADYGTDIGSFREEALLKEYASSAHARLAGRDLASQCRSQRISGTWRGATASNSLRDVFRSGLFDEIVEDGIRLFKGVSKSRAYHFGSKSTGRVVKNKDIIVLSQNGMTSSTLTKYYLRRGETF